MEQRKFVFIKDYVCQYGTLHMNDEIILFRDNVYFNGGMVTPGYRSILLNIVNNEKLRREYLKQVQIIQNKV